GMRANSAAPAAAAQRRWRRFIISCTPGLEAVEQFNLLFGAMKRTPARPYSTASSGKCQRCRRHAGCCAPPFGYRSEIRPLRLLQADPLTLVVFDRVLGADSFSIRRDQATVGNTGGQRRGEYLRIRHGHFELQSLETDIRAVTPVSAAATDGAL